MKRLVAVIVASIALGAPLFSQEPAKPVVPEPVKANEPKPSATQKSAAQEPATPTAATPTMEEIVVTATREERPESRVPYATSVVTSEQIEQRLPPTAPDALEGEVGVVIQKTNLGGGSPIIRGRSGKDNLLLIDGQRFNNSTFRRNHQYLNTIDLAAIDRFEIVRGPTSVLYGSDAMGGTVNLITRRRELTGELGFGGRLFLQYESAANALIGHLSGETEFDNWGITAGVTSRYFDDLRAGRIGDPVGAVDIDGVQDPTGYRERDFSASVIRKLSDTDTIDFLMLYDRQYKVPRSDVIIANDKEPNPPDLVRDSDPQRLRWYELRYRHVEPTSMLESLTITASLNNPVEGRTRIRVSSPDQATVEKDEVFVPGISAQAGIRYDADHLLTTGLEAYYERVDTSRVNRDLTTGALTPGPGRYPDGSIYESYGVFAQDEWKLTDTLTWVNGVRYSLFRVSADFNGLVVDSQPPFDQLHESFDDFTFATGLTAQVTEHTSVYGSISRGFRAPNLDDLAILGDFSAGDRVPNLDLDPETVLNFEVGTKYATPRVRTGASVAAAFYQDLLENKFLFNDGTTDFFQVDNVSRARILSLEGWLEYVMLESDGSAPRHVLYSNAFWSVGRNETDNEPVSKVPPAEGTLGYRLEGADDGWFAETDVHGALRQNRLATVDEADPRFPEGGTPGWLTFNVRGGIDVAQGVRLSAGLENIFNVRYRVHGSGIDGPGRNVVLALDWRF